MGSTEKLLSRAENFSRQLPEIRTVQCKFGFWSVSNLICETPQLGCGIFLAGLYVFFRSH